MPSSINYQSKTGCQWRLLPHDFPPEGTVRRYFHYFKRTRRFDPISNALRPQVCEQERHAAEPSLAMIDSQSVKAANTADERGYDGEKITDVKRHFLVDVLGLLICIGGACDEHRRAG